MSDEMRLATLWQELTALCWQQYNERCRWVALGAEWLDDIDWIRHRARKAAIAREYWMLSCQPPPQGNQT